MHYDFHTKNSEFLEQLKCDNNCTKFAQKPIKMFWTKQMGNEAISGLFTHINETYLSTWQLFRFRWIYG